MFRKNFLQILIIGANFRKKNQRKFFSKKISKKNFRKKFQKIFFLKFFFANLNYSGKQISGEIFSSLAQLGPKKTQNNPRIEIPTIPF